jgi:hypothetical protein
LNDIASSFYVATSRQQTFEPRSTDAGCFDITPKKNSMGYVWANQNQLGAVRPYYALSASSVLNRLDNLCISLVLSAAKQL